MTDIQARIDGVMELDKARTPGEWYRDIAHAIRSYVNSTLHQVSDQVWPFVNLKESDFQFILAAPEMVSIIKELQAQLSELQEENAHIKKNDDRWKQVSHNLQEQNYTIIMTKKLELETKDIIIAELQKEKTSWADK